MDNKTTTEVAWAAGFFDGEGCVSLHDNRGYSILTLHVSQTELTILERFQHAIGDFGNIYGPRQHKAIKNISKPSWDWQCSRREHIEIIIDTLRPFLHHTKLTQAQASLFFLKTFFPKPLPNELIVADSTPDRKCPRGHDMSTNFLITKRGYKRCRECQKIWNTARREIPR